MSETEKKEKKPFEEVYNRKERLKAIKRGILNYLSKAGERNRIRIEAKLSSLKMWEDPYIIYRGGKSKKVLVQPSKEEITYCLNYLKNKNQITYDEKRELWIIIDKTGEKKKRITLDDFLSN